MTKLRIGESLNSAIESHVRKTLEAKDDWNPETFPDEYIATDSFAEAVEKLVIVHIRTWMLEDAIQEAKTAEEIADLKKKIDICFKIKRPRLVQAINRIVNDAILYEKSLQEDSVKLYKGVK